MHSDPAAIKKSVRTYLSVGAMLLVFTAITVAANQFHFAVPVAITVALIIAGMNRRMYDGGLLYTHNAGVLHWNVVQGYAAWSLGLFQVFFIVNFFMSIKWGKAVDRNPWDATTLEWAAPSPPGHGNFLTEPIVYRGPYEYSVPGAARDFSPQFEPEKA